MTTSNARNLPSRSEPVATAWVAETSQKSIAKARYMSYLPSNFDRLWEIFMLIFPDDASNVESAEDFDDHSLKLVINRATRRFYNDDQYEVDDSTEYAIFTVEFGQWYLWTKEANFSGEL